MMKVNIHLLFFLQLVLFVKFSFSFTISTHGISYRRCKNIKNGEKPLPRTSSLLEAVSSFDNANEQYNAKCILETCSDAWNDRDLEALMACFSDDCQYEDAMFATPSVVDKSALTKRIETAIKTMPKSTKVVVDHIANDRQSNKIGAKWHLEFNNRTIPFTRGCSFYTTDAETGLIKTGFRVMESPMKPDDIIFNTLAVPFRIADILAGPSKDTTSELPESYETMSPIEKTYYWWNRRDMTAAVQIFDKNVLYEDTLYIRPFSGRTALKNHLERVANQLPRVCKIVVDQQAIDPNNGNIGVCWHLEVEGNEDMLNGWSRGCSMYTTDQSTGLVTSGFDVTESPIKADERIVSTVTTPLQSILPLL